MIDLAAIYSVWLRDIIRSFREKSRFLGSLARPILWLVIMGTGLRPAFQGGGVDYLHFIFPGVIAMTLIFTATQSAISIIWDREFGFLKEMLVAPIPRSSIVIGKALSGSTTATMQGIITLLFAPFIGVKMSPLMIVEVLGLMFLISFALTSLGLVIASRMKSFEGFGTISNFVVMPMYFLSGAIFPTAGLPLWLKSLIFMNPLSYGVDAMRKVILGLGSFPMALDLGFVACFGVAMVGVAVPFFSREG